jgi:imidazolonepropionase-like amidohydrolase
VAIVCAPFFLQAKTTLIHAGKLIDGKSDKAQTKMTIVINDNLITDVIKGYKNPKDDETYLDLKGHTVLPGLMDMHVHFGGEYQSKAERPSKVEKEMEAILATQDAYVTFFAGFTTVRQVGDSGMVAISLRDAINQGKLVGPRIFTSGKSLATTGGHADPTNGRKKSMQGDPGPMEGVINSVDDARKAVRQRYKDGADNIKITATGGVMSIAKNGQNP